MTRTLKGILKLTTEAMAGIDASYWMKCIQHLKKEVRYYMLHDKIFQDSDSFTILVDKNESKVDNTYILDAFEDKCELEEKSSLV